MHHLLPLIARRLPVVAFTWFGLALVAFAASPGPEQWGERYAHGLISGAAGTEEALVRELFAESVLKSVGAERLAGQMARIRKDFAPDELHHAELVITDLAPGNSRRVLHVYVRRRGDPIWRDIQMILEATPPHRIASIAFIAEVTEPVALPNGEIDDPMTLDWLDRYVTKLNRENDLAGSILIARGNQVLFERQFGFADLERQQAVDARTLFNLGSGNKMFTALAVMQQVDAGRLGLDDPLRKFFPDYPVPEMAGQVKLRHLLAHSSGIGEFWRPETEAAMRAAVSWHDLLPLVRQAGFDFKPGTAASYSNSNYLLLGAILEQVTGRDYFDLITERIYQPAGMKTAGSFSYDPTTRALAVPLSRDVAAKEWREAPHNRRGSPTGGGYATAADLLAFSQALRHHRLIGPASLRRMTANANAGLADGFAYGLGFIPERHGRTESYGHGGIARGVNFEFRYFPATDITLVMFSNQDNGAFDDLRKNATRLITGQR